MENETSLDNYFTEEWEKLTFEEQLICLNYERQLLMNKKVFPGMLREMNKIHAKYPDFHVGCIPKKANVLEFKSNNFEELDFLPELA